MKRVAYGILNLVFVLSLGLAIISPLNAQAFDVQKAIAAGDHKELAEYYRSQAEAQRKMAETHNKMKTSYRESHIHYKGTENVMAGHCGNLKFQALKSAERYDALARQEEKLAGVK